MTVLVIDDQIHVVDGILSEVDWDGWGLKLSGRRTVRRRLREFFFLIRLTLCCVILRCPEKTDFLF